MNFNILIDKVTKNWLLSLVLMFAALIGFYSYYYELKFKKYESQISLIKKTLTTQEGKDFFNLKKIIITRDELTNLNKTFSAITKNSIVYFNDTFVDNDWKFQKMSLKEYDKRFSKHVKFNKNYFNSDIYVWSNYQSTNALDENLKSYISLKVFSSNDIMQINKEIFQNANNVQLNQKVENVLNNYIAKNAIDNFKYIFELNNINNSDKLKTIKFAYEDRTLYLRQFFLEDGIHILKELFIIVLKDTIVEIDLRIASLEGLSNDNGYINKWFNNIRIVGKQ